MPINVPLTELRRDLRAEVGQTLNMAMGTQAQGIHDNQLDRQQRELWSQYEWPHLRYWVDKQAYAGQADYDYPEEMPFDSINRVYWADASGGNLKVLAYGLHAVDFQPGTAQQGTPRRWGNIITVTAGKTDPIGKFRLLPTPSATGLLRFEGQAPCNPLVAADDKCVIDSKAIVLFAAAEIMAVQKVEAAQLKLIKAQNYLRRVLANQGADKRVSYNMGGVKKSGIDHFAARPYQNAAVPGIDYIP